MKTYNLAAVFNHDVRSALIKVLKSINQHLSWKNWSIMVLRSVVLITESFVTYFTGIYDVQEVNVLGQNNTTSSRCMLEIIYL